jgi:hypothetical protein
MSDADVLTSTETLEHEGTIGGQTITLVVQEPTMGELNAINEDLPEGAQEADLAYEMVDQFLEEPDVHPDDMGLTKMLAVFSEMQSAFQQSDTIQDAKAAMELDDEGNR